MAHQKPLSFFIIIILSHIYYIYEKVKFLPNHSEGRNWSYFNCQILISTINNGCFIPATYWKLVNLVVVFDMCQWISLIHAYWHKIWENMKCQRKKIVLWTSIYGKSYWWFILLLSETRKQWFLDLFRDVNLKKQYSPGI